MRVEFSRPEDDVTEIVLNGKLFRPVGDTSAEPKPELLKEIVNGVEFKERRRYGNFGIWSGGVSFGFTASSIPRIISFLMKLLHKWDVAWEEKKTISANEHYELIEDKYGFRIMMRGDRMPRVNASNSLSLATFCRFFWLMAIKHNIDVTKEV